MDKTPPLTREAILQELACLLGDKRTGTFFITTPMNTSCRFAVEAGRLTHGSHRRDLGLDAVRSLMAMDGGSCAFADNQVLAFSPAAAIDHTQAMECLGIQPLPPVPPPQKKDPRDMKKPSAGRRYYRGALIAD